VKLLDSGNKCIICATNEAETEADAENAQAVEVKKVNLAAVLMSCVKGVRSKFHMLTTHLIIRTEVGSQKEKT
jgi:hypothetical protein